MACGSTTEVHLSQKTNQQTNSISLFVLAKNGYFVIFFLIAFEILNLLDFEKIWLSFGPLLALTFSEGSKILAYSFECYF